jgi:hypothetical protein
MAGEKPTANPSVHIPLRSPLQHEFRDVNAYTVFLTELGLAFDPAVYEDTPFVR